MQWRNDTTRYGLAAVLMHWLVALTVFGLFGLGLWMTGLTYYDQWYQLGPWWHKSIGVSLFLLVLVRLGWRALNPQPVPLPSHARWEHRLAKTMHGLLYLLLFAIMISGYLISTADGRSLEVFGWFAIPATLHGIEHQEDIAGTIHLTLAITLVALASLHALAALKHHFLDRDRTLMRMLGR
ncbi:cytochrome b [Thiohalomonas denitrificans]|uniref:Cytochrome b561 n=1 Tax=Thiohalomonas denitrificans TaxID=415747 RepID=A0A1G5Q6X5_9GAMM|nr:cytochrome b [Thiohalomonas denitrificans]SCZ57412.1 cytochrome b561 [Thiohalomonas denitrificans]